MAKENAPSPASLREIFSYDNATGDLTWKSGRRLAGRRAGSNDGRGYIQMYIDGFRCRAHQVVVAMHAGAWPAGPIDHINGNPSDNRIENLRFADAFQNSANRPKSGVTKTDDRFRAQIMHRGQRISLGIHSKRSDAEAIAAFADVLLNKEFAVDQSKSIVRKVLRHARITHARD